MKAEIVSVGTELLLGSITDTNATYLAQRLAALGIDLYHVSQVGDNLARIVDVLRRAWERSDLTVTTGGLGPTQDDLTREAIAEVLGESPRVSPELEDQLRSLYRRRSVAMPESNLKQATLIPSASPLPNPIGTAPGWFVKARSGHETRMIVAMPGVPFEMRRMWEVEVEPRLRGLSGNIIVSRTLKTLGLGESRVEEMVSDLMRSTDPTLAPYAKSDGVYLRITAKSTDATSASEKIAVMERAVRDRLGDAIYGADDETPQGVVGSLLNELAQSFLILEVGRASASSLGAALGAHPLCAGTVSVASLEDLGRLFDIKEPPSTLEEAARALSTPFLPLVFAVGTETHEVGDRSAVGFEVEVLILLDGAIGRLARSRASWRSAPSEVGRLAGLAALNLLRKELQALANSREGSVLC